MSKTLDYYKRLPYRRVVERRVEEDGGVYFIARIAEIPFIRIDGATREEALAKLSEMFEDCIAGMIQDGEEIPEPEPWPGRDFQPPGPHAAGDADLASSVQGSASIVVASRMRPRAIVDAPHASPSR